MCLLGHSYKNKQTVCLESPPEKENDDPEASPIRSFIGKHSQTNQPPLCDEFTFHLPNRELHLPGPGLLCREGSSLPSGQGREIQGAGLHVLRR